MNVQGILLLILLVGAAAFFVRRMKVIVRIIMGGKPDQHLLLPKEGFRNFFSLVVLQKKLLQEPFEGWLHVFIFYGFLVLSVGTLEMILMILAPGTSFAFLGPLYHLFLTSQDLLSALVTFAVLHGIYRRLILKPARLQGSREATKDALLVLGIILFLMVTLILMNAGCAGMITSPGSCPSPGWSASSSPAAKSKPLRCSTGLISGCTCSVSSVSSCSCPILSICI